MIQIEKSIPLPETKTKPMKYPFGKMKVGDSFFVESGNNKQEAARKTVYQSSRNFCRLKKLKWGFRTAVTDDGVRVWRIK